MDAKRFYIKLYSKNHVLIDDLEIFNNLTYTNTLNGMGQMTFTTPIGYLADKGIEPSLGQHIELYKVDSNNKEQILWYGVVNTPTPTENDVECVCLGYASLLQNRKFTNIELNAENEWKTTYYNQRYGELIFKLITQINLIKDTGIVVGENIDSDKRTDRIINWDDDLYDKIQEFIEDSNCYFTINPNRQFNFYNSVGVDKSDYYEITDYNVVDTWDYTVDQTQIVNSVFGRSVIDVEVEGQEEPATKIIMSHAEDEDSINVFGYREAIIDLGSVTEQSTADAMVQDHLQTYKKPLTSLNIRVGITDNFDIFNINVGDYVLISSNRYKLNTKIRVLEYTVELNTMTVDITLGNAFFREQAVSIYRY